MEATHYVTHHTRRLRERRVGTVTAVVHGVKNAAVYRFEAVTYVRQGAPNNHTHGVVEVGALHFQLQIDALNAVIQEAHVVSVALDEATA